MGFATLNPSYELLLNLARWVLLKAKLTVPRLIPRRQRPLHRLRVLCDHREIGTDRAGGRRPSLFPILHARGIEAEALRKLRLRQLEFAAHFRNIDFGRHVDAIARRIGLAARNLARLLCRLDQPLSEGAHWTESSMTVDASGIYGFSV